jgi:hypothetical protein
MFKLIPITAIAVGALLIALLAMEMSRPGRSSSQRAFARQIPQARVLQLAGEFHVRLLVAAGKRLDWKMQQAGGHSGSWQQVADVQQSDAQ